MLFTFEIHLRKMSELILSSQEIHKGLKLLGLNLTKTELDTLKIGNLVSLESRSLSEIGSMFILAGAISSVILGKKKKEVTFQDLPTVEPASNMCFGIPIYCWQLNYQGKF